MDSQPVYYYNYGTQDEGLVKLFGGLLYAFFCLFLVIAIVAIVVCVVVAGIVIVAGVGMLYVAYLIFRFMLRNLWRLIKYCYRRYRLRRERKYGIVSKY